jgi:hypothetical protein
MEEGKVGNRTGEDDEKRQDVHEVPQQGTALGWISKLPLPAPGKLAGNRRDGQDGERLQPLNVEEIEIDDL